MCFMDICFNDEYRYIKLCVLGKKIFLIFFSLKLLLNVLKKKIVIVYLFDRNNDN